MKTRNSIVLAALLVLVNHTFLSMGLADPKPRASAAPRVAEAVFQLSEQAKKEELIERRNHPIKIVPIEPVLGREMKPDPVDAPAQ